MRILNARSSRRLGAGLAAVLLLTLVGSIPGSHAGPAPPEQPAAAAPIRGGTFNIHLDLPDGSLVEYVRIYYYDIVAANSHVWLTRYDDGQAYSDVLYVGSTGSAGYGTALSAQSSHIVDNLAYAYVLNWRPDDLGPGLQLCGLRVAYRLDGGASHFYYEHFAGAALRPRDGGTTWRYGGNGCLYQERFGAYLPVIVRNH